MLEHQYQNRSEGKKSNDRARLIAGNIYGQWIAQQLFGEEVYEDQGGKRRSRTIGTLGSAIQQLERAAASKYPAKLFGDHVATEYSSMFNLGDKFNPVKQINVALEGIVTQAVREIYEALPVRDETDDDSCKITYRRTEFVRRYDSLTYLALDETDVPWTSMPASEGVADAPDVDIPPATSEVLHMLGISDAGIHEQPEKGQEAEGEQADLGALEIGEGVAQMGW